MITTKNTNYECLSMSNVTTNFPSMQFLPRRLFRLFVLYRLFVLIIILFFAENTFRKEEIGSINKTLDIACFTASA